MTKASLDAKQKMRNRHQYCTALYLLSTSELLEGWPCVHAPSLWVGLWCPG